MAKSTSNSNRAPSVLQKTPTGIKGLDEITMGGLPRGRTTLVCGGPGCGKTLLATEFLVRGVLEYDEPGVFMAFEETSDDLAKNTASLGIDLNDLIERKKLFVDYVYIERSEIEETGEYDLEGLFIRLATAIDAIGAKRVVLDTIETIFAGFANDSILRSEIRRLFRWLKNKGVTAIVTGERGDTSLTRYGLEEYVSDCVILLDMRMENKMANRILRVVKYRGSAHGTDEYPFLIGDTGLWVQPITSLGLNYEVSSEHISSGVADLDKMLDNTGYYSGSSILVSGQAGTGKTSLAASLVDSACRRGERCLYIAFEESTHQIMRNMCSIGIDLEPWVKEGLLLFRAARPSFYGIEMHLLMLQKLVEEFQPSVMVIDPLTNLVSIGTAMEVKSMLVRLIDFLKIKGVTTLFTSLTYGGDNEAQTEVGVSSLMDTWLLVRSLEAGGERTRTLYVLKARGMPHSSQIREFCLTDRGIKLVDVYVGPEGVFTGAGREIQLSRERMAAQQLQARVQTRKRQLERNRKVVESQMAAMRVGLENEEDLFRQEQEQARVEQELQSREFHSMKNRREDAAGDNSPERKKE